MATIKGVSSFSAEQEAQALRKAMKGFGTDEDAIIDILTKLNVSQRQQVLITYKSTIGRDLIDDLKSELSGNFERVIIGMMTPTTLYDVHELKRAMKGNRDEGMYVDDALAQQDAQCLYEAGEKKWGTDEVQFMSILCTRNRCHLLRVKCMRNKPAYFAERLYKSMKGLGTDDNTLIRVMVSRSEIDMLDIRREFLTMYGKSLYSFIKGDCSGDYRKVLLRLCGGED
ncbi:Annexin A4 [Aix galericulata]|nr:Annexin A4 [Aix galericulata]